MRIYCSDASIDCCLHVRACSGDHSVPGLAPTAMGVACQVALYVTAFLLLVSCSSCTLVATPPTTVRRSSVTRVRAPAVGQGGAQRRENVCSRCTAEISAGLTSPIKSTNQLTAGAGASGAGASAVSGARVAESNVASEIRE